MISVQFKNRDDTLRESYPWSGVSVLRYSRHAFGGPKKAQLRVFGSNMALWELAEMAGCPVVIRDEGRAKSVFWGRISKIKVNVDGDTRTISILDMTNKVKVAYTLDGARGTTSWASNADSIAEYGTRELIITEQDLMDTQAQSSRDTRLALSKYPEMSMPSFGRSTVNMATVEVIGLWDTLDWMYYANDLGKESYEDLDTWYGREIGEDDRPMCAQSFQLSSSSGWDAYSIRIRVRMHGSPTDNVRVDLCSDSGGSPGSTLAYCSLTYDNFSSSYAWIDFPLSSTVTLSTSTTYWIKVQMVGTIDPDNCYVVDGNESAGYDNGVFRVYSTNASIWRGWMTMEMNFQVIGKQETTEQLETVVTNCGQFLLDTDIINDSGVYREQYRSGDTTGLYEAVKLLEMGTTNDRRLLARVLENLHLEVYEEPAQYSADYTIDPEGVIRDEHGAVVPKADCPVGMWLRYVESAPSTVNTSQLSSVDYLFVEAAEYNVGRDEYKITKTRGSDTVNRLLGQSDRDLSRSANDLWPLLIDKVRDMIGHFNGSALPVGDYGIRLYDVSDLCADIYSADNDGLSDAIDLIDTGDLIVLPPGSGFSGYQMTSYVNGDFHVFGSGKYATTFSYGWSTEYDCTGNILYAYLKISQSFSSTSSSLSVLTHGGTGVLDVYDVYLSGNNSSNGKVHVISAVNTGDVHIWNSNLICDPTSGEGYITRCNDAGAEIHLHNCIINYKTGIDNSGAGDVYLYNCVDLADSGNIISAKYEDGSLVWKRVIAAASGQLTLEGDARVWKDFDLSPDVVKLPGSNPPSEDDIDSYPFHRYDRSTEESIHFIWNVPHDFASGAASVKGDFKFIVENPPAGGGSNEVVVMGFAYTKLSEGDVFAASETTGTVSETIVAGETAKIIHITPLGSPNTTGWAPGDTILFRFYRDATNAADTYDNEAVAADNDVWVYDYHMEYLADKLGEAS